MFKLKPQPKRTLLNRPNYGEVGWWLENEEGWMTRGIQGRVGETKREPWLRKRWTHEASKWTMVPKLTGIPSISR